MKKIVFAVSLLLGVQALAANEAADLAKYAFAMLKKMPVSGSANRQLCLGTDKSIVGTYYNVPFGPGQYMLAVGNTSQFPQSVSPINDLSGILYIKESGPLKKISQKPGVDFYITSGTIKGQPAAICIFESKGVSE